MVDLSTNTIMKHISEPQKDQYRGDINVLKLCASDNIHMYVFIYV